MAEAKSTLAISLSEVCYLPSLAFTHQSRLEKYLAEVSL